MRPSQQVRELVTIVSGETTDELLHKLLANLAAILGARRAYVTVKLDEKISRTIASWEDDERGPEREYAVAGTPCATVLCEGVFVVDSDLGARYSLQKSSMGFGFESFIGGPLLDRHGSTIGQVCVFSDNPVDDSEMAGALISLAAVRVSAELEHRQQQDSLLRQRRQLETLLGNLPGMAYRCDYDQIRRMHFVSQGCGVLTGYDSEQLVDESNNWTGLIHEDDRDRVWDEVQSALSAGSNFEVQYRIFTKDGRQKWAWERGCGVADEDGRIAALEGFVSDLTELKESEEEARHHRERIAHVSRLSTLGEMAAGIAHEINQPLTAISLFAQAGKRLAEAGELAKMDDVFKKLNEHALRASAVIERMQAMARRGESKKEIADCSVVIESAVKLAESEARIHDIQVEFEMDEGLPPVFIDAVQIQQVALNLLRNGMEAMVKANGREGRSVDIQTRVRDQDNIEVAVIDTGGGIQEKNVEKLFTPFSTTKKSGMGMGLSISKAIIKAHGGQLDFKNNDIGGATFWFTLPVANREIHDE